MNSQRPSEKNGEGGDTGHVPVGSQRTTDVLEHLQPETVRPESGQSWFDPLADRTFGDVTGRGDTAIRPVLGNYRLLERLGSGGMGTVFKAEHLHLKRPVAIKVLHSSHGPGSQVVHRFYAEMQTLAAIHHPNIVYALDAGAVPGVKPNDATTYYLVMEFIPGQDLERLVRSQGWLTVEHACDLVQQVACALAEAHRNRLIHRDIKPPNIVRTPEGQAKLLDFGLARHFRHRMTEPGVILGTIDYMAPEQFEDAASVDARADIYGLGGTLYWCLTGQTPFPAQPTLLADLSYRMLNPPPSPRTLRPEIPEELDAAVRRMLAQNPEDRFPSPEAVSQALQPFLVHPRGLLARGGTAAPDNVPSRTSVQRVLITDDEAAVRKLCRISLEAKGLACAEAADGAEALEALSRQVFDVVITDVDMPKMSGTELLKRIRERHTTEHLKVVMISGGATGEEMASLLQAGADDYLTKPLSVVLQSRVHAALSLKKAQDQATRLHRRLLDVNANLERDIVQEASDAALAQKALCMALSRTIEQRLPERRGRGERLRQMARCLAEAARAGELGAMIDDDFLDRLELCVPLQDIGMIGLPDHILLKPGKLDAEERTVMQTHAVIGLEMLAAVAQHHGKPADFLQTAAIVARHHHERWDGTGYPDGHSGANTPLAARVAAMVDVYDALRSRRPYRPPLGHRVSLKIIVESHGQFDPALLQAFLDCADDLDTIWQSADA
jgi:response regulator RpfG family c-di-GMP phosphodiesterase/serine/threonine protein kinase